MSTTMKPMSLKVRADILENMTIHLRNSKLPRNAYINQALEAYNALNRRRDLATQLAAESKIVSPTSLEVLAELEKIDDLYEN